jgi:hypothetical protein
VFFAVSFFAVEKYNNNPSPDQIPPGEIDRSSLKDAVPGCFKKAASSFEKK